MDLQRFIDAQKTLYFQALKEIKSGKKQSHWMWFIFPQLKGLGHSETANYYGITGIEHAQHFFEHPVLGTRLIEISTALLHLQGRTALAIFGYPDDIKLHSCMTLFSQLENSDPIFAAVIKKYFHGKKDRKTMELLNSKIG